MNKPAELPAATHPSRAIPVAHCFPSPTNPRKHPNQAKRLELAASMKLEGQLQDIIVRPWPEEYGIPEGADLDLFADLEQPFEIVVGHSRHWGAEYNEWPTIDAKVRELTNAQVLRMQIAENDKRDDVHPLDRAESYANLMREEGLSPEHLAAELGISRSQAYNTLRLLNLVEPVREAMYAGELENTVGLLLSSLPKKLQEAAFKEVFKGIEGKPLSFRAAKQHIADKYQVDLTQAVWDLHDATLAPAAGNCVLCQKNTNINTDLRAEFDGRTNVCTDPTCYSEKRIAFHVRVKETALANEVKVLEGEEARKFMPSGPADLDRTKHINLDAKCKEDRDGRTYREILGDKAPVAVVVATPRSRAENPEFVQVGETKAVAAALKKAGITLKGTENLEGKNAETQQTEDAERREKQRKLQAHQELQHQIDVRFSKELFQAIRLKFGEQFARTCMLASEDLISLAEHHFVNWACGTDFDEDYELDFLRMWGHTEWIFGGEEFANDDHAANVAAFRDRIRQMDAGQASLLLVDLALIDIVPVDSDEQVAGRLISEADRLGIDHRAMREKIAKELSAAPGEQEKTDASSDDATSPGTNQLSIVLDEEKASPELPWDWLKVGVKVTVKEGNGPNGKPREHVGLTGTIEAQRTTLDPYYVVRFAKGVKPNSARLPIDAMQVVAEPTSHDWPQPNEFNCYPEGKSEAIEWKSGKNSLRLNVLQIGEKQWIWAEHFKHAEGGHGGPLTKTHCPPLSSRTECIAEAIEEWRGKTWSDLKPADKTKLLKWIDELAAKELAESPTPSSAARAVPPKAPKSAAQAPAKKAAAKAKADPAPTASAKKTTKTKPAQASPAEEHKTSGTTAKAGATAALAPKAAWPFPSNTKPATKKGEKA